VLTLMRSIVITSHLLAHPPHQIVPRTSDPQVTEEFDIEYKFASGKSAAISAQQLSSPHDHVPGLYLRSSWTHTAM